MTPIPAQVDWADAHTSAGWFAVDDIPQDGCLQRSVGWLIAGAVPGCLTLAQTVDPHGTFGDLLHVPLSLVRAVWGMEPRRVLPVEGLPETDP